MTALLAPALLLVLAACGDPAEGPGIASAGGATPSATASQAAQKGDPVKFAECMREHGVEVNMPEGEGGPVQIKGGPADAGKLAEAQRECRKYAPAGGPGDGKPMSKADQEKFLRFAQCMREHGIPMADPKFTGGGVELMIGDGKGGTAPQVDQGKVDAAHKACQSILPEPPDGGEGGFGGPEGGGQGPAPAGGGGA